MAGYGAQYGVGTYGEEPATGIPALQNQSPAAGATEAAPYGDIYLEVVDPDATLVASTVILTVNGVVAWSGDAEQNEFSVTKTAITDGFSYEITPPRPFDRGANVFVEVFAENDIPNQLEAGYSFTVGTQRFLLKRDDFDNATVDLLTAPGNGIITEPAGTQLKLDGPNSQNCQWWSGTANAPRAYYPIKQSWKAGRTGVFMVENKLDQYDESIVNISFGGGPMLYNDAQNAYFSGFYDNNDDIRLQRIIANSADGRWDCADGRPHPNTTPHRYRIYWNPGLRDFYLEDLDVYLPAGYVGFAYSTDNGSTWVWGYSEASALQDWDNFGVFLRKWDAGATANAQVYIDYLEMWEIPSPQIYEQVEPGDAFGDATTPQNSPSKAAVEDVSAPVQDAEGPLAHGGFPAGTLLPGPPDQSTGSIGPSSMAGAEDVSAPSRDMVLMGQPNQIAQQVASAGQIGRAVASIEDVSQYFQSVLTDYRTDTTDGEGHAHFIGERVVYAFVYEAANEGGLWTTPTDPSFTGYGQDGYEYIAGVQQPSGPHAPWATETAGTDRSSRADFPDKALICVTFDGFGFTPAEVVIFDLDGYPTNLDVWMRFRFGTSGGTYTMMGRVNQKPTDVQMANGILVVPTEQGDYRGGVHIVNFKATGNDSGHLIRSDAHLKWNGSIATRNTAGGWVTTGVSPSLRIDPEEVWDISVYGKGVDTWVAIGGEDPGPNVLRIQDVPNWMIGTTGDVGDVDAGDIRNMVFDENGWLFLSINNRVYRILPIDYGEGLVHVDSTDRAKRVGSPATTVLFPTNIKKMVSEGRYIYLALETGIYMMHVATMEYWLAYTIVGDGGKGRDNGTPGDGELLAGGDSSVNDLAMVRRYMTELSTWMHYLSVGTRSGATLIRLWDEVVVDARIFNDLHEPSAWFNMSLAE